MGNCCLGLWLSHQSCIPSLRPVLWVPPQPSSGEVRVSSGKCPCLEVWPKIAMAAAGGGLGGISFWGTEWPEEAKGL